MNDYELALKKTPARYMYVCVVKGKDNKNTRERDISRKNRHSERSNPHAKQSVRNASKRIKKKVRVRNRVLTPLYKSCRASKT